MKSILLFIATALLLPFSGAVPTGDNSAEAGAVPVEARDAEVDLPEDLAERSPQPYYITYWGSGCNNNPSQHYNVPYYPNYACRPVAANYDSIYGSGTCSGYYYAYYYRGHGCGGHYFSSGQINPNQCHNVPQAYWTYIKITCFH